METTTTFQASNAEVRSSATSCSRSMSPCCFGAGFTCATNGSARSFRCGVSIRSRGTALTGRSRVSNPRTNLCNGVASEWFDQRPALERRPGRMPLAFWQLRPGDESFVLNHFIVLKDTAMILRVATLNQEQNLKRWEDRRELIAAQQTDLQPDNWALNEIHVPSRTG